MNEEGDWERGADFSEPETDRLLSSPHSCQKGEQEAGLTYVVMKSLSFLRMFASVSPLRSGAVQIPENAAETRMR